MARYYANFAYLSLLGIMWLPTQHMYRFAENGTPVSLMAFLDELFTAETLTKATENVYHFVDEVKTGFEKAVGPYYYLTHFKIRKDPATCYCMYFFTSHIKGFEKMLEAKWDIDRERGEIWDYQGGIATLWEPIKTNPLAEAIKGYLQISKRTNSELYEFVLREGFLPTHANQILTDWRKQGILSVTEKNGIPFNRGFHISYFRDRDENFNRLIFRLN